MRSVSLLLASLVLSACATTGGSPNGWGAPRSGDRARAAERAPERAERPAPPVRVERPPIAERPERRAEADRRPGTASGLVIPVVGIEGHELRDSFHAGRSGGRTHNAIDIAAPTGTPLVAVTDGTISRKHWNALGGRTLYLTSADGRYDYYYAHLDSYADGIEIGSRVRRGEVLGTVGATGNAQGAHLHFQVLDKRGGGRGTPVNPYDLLRTAELAIAD
jgi:murein DD-endopeptidase MepM/ murein hydrolase activator NlpD